MDWLKEATGATLTRGDAGTVKAGVLSPFTGREVVAVSFDIDRAADRRYLETIAADIQPRVLGAFAKDYLDEKILAVFPFLSCWITCASPHPDNGQRNEATGWEWGPATGTRYPSPVTPSPVTRHGYALPDPVTRHVFPSPATGTRYATPRRVWGAHLAAPVMGDGC